MEKASPKMTEQPRRTWPKGLFNFLPSKWFHLRLHESNLQKFFNDHCIDTFRSLLSYYAELRPDQIKRVLVFFHRIFVKRKQQVILYRLDICELLSRMMNDEINIPTGSSIRRHLEDFAKHYIYSLTKALAKTPILFVEVIFSLLSC